jgi:signal transduction histidine kinase
MTFRRYGGPPHWWPTGEAWPPRDPAYHWRRRRARFMGRVALALSLFSMLSALGAATLASLAGHAFGGIGRPAWTVMVAVIIALAMGNAIRLLRRIGSPMGDLVSAAHQVAGGDFSARVRPSGPPSLRAVATAFNDMAERLAAQEKQRRELMADIAHELRTPLSVVQGRLEGLIDGVYPSDPSQLEPLLDETRVLARLVDDLRTLANAESGVLTLQREPTDVGMLVHDAVSAVQGEAARQRVTITIDEAPAASAVDVDPVRLRQVLVNLLANAIHHGGAGSAVTVTIQHDGVALVIKVADSGPGIPPEDLPKIFDRFYKRRGSTGSGLGLTIARTLVRAHGGDVTAESRLGAGTVITVRVPIAKS